VSSFVTGAYAGGAGSSAESEEGGGHGIMANVFYDLSLQLDKPLDTSDTNNMKHARQVYGRIQKAANLGEILAGAGFNYSVLTTGKIGNAKLLNLEADKFRHKLFSIWGRDISSAAIDYDRIIRDFGPPPEQEFPNNMVTEYATKLLLEYFLCDVTTDVQVIWYNEPDLSFHYRGIGAPESLSTIRSIDENFGKILDWWNAEGRSKGWHIIVVSDHAQITTIKQINVIEELRKGGFNAGIAVADGIDIAVKRSYSGQITVRDRNPKLIKRVLEFLQDQYWCGLTFTRTGLYGALCMADINGLNERSPDINYVMRTFDGVNEFGYPGLCYADNPDIPHGGGIHGGLHKTELNNLMVFGGDRFKREMIFDVPSSIVDVLPTILCGLDVRRPKTIMGRSLNEVFLDGGDNPDWSERCIRASRNDYSQEMLIAEVQGGSCPYLRGGKRTS
tara:strand:- start:1967 stop:3304 length:1338 start_codon:yes stop_codon:yes gene_type:complete